MRFVRLLLDTNILLSGLISPSLTQPPARLLDAARQEQFVLVTSPAQIDELREVAERPRIQKYLKPGVVDELLRFIDAAAHVVLDVLPHVTESPDPKDNMILATALAGQANLIVSGDKRHVLSLEAFRGIPIVTAARAVELIQSSERQ
jgi:uncharacterized protein